MNTVLLMEKEKSGPASELLVYNCHNCKKVMDCRPCQRHSQMYLGDCFITQFVSSNFEDAKSEIKTIQQQFDIIQHTIKIDGYHVEKIKKLITLLDEQNEGRNRILSDLKREYQL